MASQTLNLNDTISYEEEKPGEALDPTDISITKPDCSENTLNNLIESLLPSSTVASGTVATGKEVDASNNKNGARSVVLANSSGIDEQVSDILKKICRAERFGMPVLLSEEEKRNTRAERFGTGSPALGSDGTKKSEEVKRKARAERFEISVLSDASDEDAKKKARLARFASASKTDIPNAVEEDKRKARAIRFSNPSSGSLPLVNGKGDIEPKAAIAIKARGGV